MGDLKFPLLKYYRSPSLPELLGKGAFGEVYHFVSKTDQQLRGNDEDDTSILSKPVNQLYGSISSVSWFSSY